MDKLNFSEVIFIIIIRKDKSEDIMNYNEISIYTKSEAIDLLISHLEDIGINSFLVEDKSDFSEFLERNRETWDMVDDDLLNLKDAKTNVKVYLSELDDDATMKRLENLLLRLKANDSEDFYGSLGTEVRIIKDEDWKNNWKKYFKPFEVGRTLVVKPTWEEYDNRDGKTILEIDPGGSFGTGSHETTRLCLMNLEKYIKGGEEVTDVGCGSGILSIAAAKLGCEHVTAVDIDPVCIKTTSELAEVNGVRDKIDVFQGDLAEKVDLKADIVVANIFAHIILRLLPDTKRILKKGGIFISSGIVSDTVEYVKQGYTDNGFEIVDVQNIGEWYSVIGEKM